MDFEELDLADLTPAILAAPPPVAENKRTMIAHGWMKVVSEDLEVSNCSRHKPPVIHYMAYRLCFYCYETVIPSIQYFWCCLVCTWSLTGLLYTWCHVARSTRFEKLEYHRHGKQSR